MLAGCKKSVDALPGATQTGANTFGLKLDGAYWVPQKFAGISAPILEAHLTGTGYNDLIIDAQNFASEPKESQFELYLKNVTGTGTYPLDQTTEVYPNSSASYGYYVKRKINPLNEWITSARYTGSVTITRWDTASRIVSGTFAFTAATTDSSAAPITVTDGRFDLKIQ